MMRLAPETLRFFEAKGLLEPERSPENSYRYFDSLDIDKIVAYLSYRRMDFSLDEASSMVNGCDLPELLAKLSVKEAALDEELRRIEAVRDRATAISASLRDYERLGQETEIVVSRELSMLEFQRGEAFLADRLQRDAFDRGMDLLPLSHPHFMLDIRDREPTLSWGFVLPSGAEAAGSSIIPEAMSIHAFFLVPENDLTLACATAGARAWFEERGLKIGGPMHGSILHEFAEKGQKRWLFEAFAPLKA